MSRNDIISTITACAADVIPDLDAAQVGPSDSLSALGADSMERAEILNATLERLNLKVSRVELFGPKNIGELAALLETKLGR